MFKSKLLTTIVIFIIVLNLCPVAIIGNADALPIIVDNNNNDGTGSLRAAVAAVQENGVIEFSSNVSTISLDSVINITTPGITIRGRVNGQNVPQIVLDAKAGKYAALSGQVVSPSETIYLTIENLVFTNSGQIAFTATTNNSVTMNNCIFRNNNNLQSGVTGAAASCAKTSYFNDCQFLNNTSVANGSIFQHLNATGSSGTTFTRCLFKDNTAASGLVSNNQNVSYYFLDCKFISNTANATGTATLISSGGSGSGGASLYNCLLYDNKMPNATDKRVVSVSTKCSLNVYQSTIVKNDGRLATGGGTSTINIYNNIIVGNGTGGTTAEQTQLQSAGTSIIQSSPSTDNMLQIFGSATPVLDANNNLMPLTTVRKTDAITGVSSTTLYDYIQKDITGASRPLSGLVTYGAYEVAAATTKTVNVDTDDVASPPDGSLRKLLTTAVDGDIIDFAPSVTQVNLLAPIVIPNATVVLVGNGNTKISGRQSNGILTYSGAAAKTLYLDKLVFEGGRATNGAAINSLAGNVTVDSCTFNDNIATANGGAISVGSSALPASIMLTALNCDFTNNSASLGGAIYSLGKSGATSGITIETGYFTNNTVSSTATDGGSAIFIEYGTIRGVNSTFYSNKSTGGKDKGLGTIFGKSTNATIALTHCTIAKNDRGIYGGNAATTRLYNCIVTDNGTGAETGAMGQTRNGYDTGTAKCISVIQSDELNTYDQLFGDNQTPVNGCLTPIPSQLTVVPPIVAVPASTNYNTVTLIAKDQRNADRDNSGSLVLAGSVTGVVPAVVDMQVTISADSGNGSLRDVVSKAMPGAKVTFNSSVTNIQLDSEIAIYRPLSIIGNVDAEGKPTVTVNGGSATRLFNINYSYIFGDFTFENIAFTNGKTTTSSDNGAAINGAIGLTVTNCRFINNITTHDSSYGGAISVSNATVDKCYFKGNSAGQGGCIRVAASNADTGRYLVITNSNFVGNTASKVSGSVVYTNNTRLTAASSTFVENLNTNDSEGTLSASNNGAGTITLLHCTVANNQGIGVHALNTGGGIGGSTAWNSIIVGNKNADRLSQSVNPDTGIGGINKIQDGNTNTFDSIFGAGSKANDDGFLYPLPSGGAASGALAIASAPNLSTSTAFDASKTDAFGTARYPIGTFGAVSLKNGMTIFKDQTGKQITALSAATTGVSAEQVTFVPDAETSRTVVLAYYTQTGVLSSIKVVTKAVDANTLTVFDPSVGIADLASGSYVAAYTLNNLTNMQPLDIKATLPYSAI